MNAILLLALVVSAVFCREYQVVVMSDFHYNEDYVENITKQSNCKNEGKHVAYDPDKAPWGRYGCDSPATFVRSAIMKAKRAVPNPEFIIVLGDLVGHGVSCEDEANCDQARKEKVKRTLSNVTKEISSRFPITPILHTMGNTDGFYHNQIPKKDEKAEYYSFLFDTYIKSHPGNRALDNADNRRTFMDGAYYYYDVNNKVRVLSINSLYFFEHNDEHNDPDTAKDQLKWIDQQLKLISREVCNSHDACPRRH
eukprot:TRINITY_DN3151_c0_g1_i1.p3 TRINITY_DN3151_c0_g1~~TRINITY_DN3151_c0_g1_i1.p3  ORF type:complete len:253 (+),score=16.65 TRINITY_DN3151_c0_g1_i1:89-847(+)